MVSSWREKAAHGSDAPSQSMRIAILANDAASYVKPIAEGLQRMLTRVGCEATVFYDGLERLARLPEVFHRYVRADQTAETTTFKRAAKYLIKEVPALGRFFLELRAFDVIVVVNT